MQDEFEFEAPSQLIADRDIAGSPEAVKEADGPGVLAASDAAPTDLTEEIAGPRDTPCTFVTGRAGTGKTTWAKRQIEADSAWGLLAATTGIAAMNLDTVTINATLAYFDTDSLRDSYLNGRLVRRLHEIAMQHRRLAIDEVSMMDAQQLDLIYRATCEANAYADVKEPLGLTLVGDFAQLPPVRATWAFDAGCWERFAASTMRLDKVWRQDEVSFLDALNAARMGDGATAVDLLTKAGVEWHSALDVEFDGTTIIPKNDAVGRYNALALDRLPGAKFTVVSRRWGKLRGEWGQSRSTKEWGVPPSADFKVGAYVMLLANHPAFEYVNGDCGHIVGYDPAEGIRIELVRNGHSIVLPKLVRGVAIHEKPEPWTGPSIPKGEDCDAYIPRPHYRAKKKTYVLGQVEFFPLRLAYASTVHRTQGLTLDNIQFDFRDPFAGQPHMCYVALSRCRTLAGLRLVGQPERFSKRCILDSRVKRWI